MRPRISFIQILPLLAAGLALSCQSLNNPSRIDQLTGERLFEAPDFTLTDCQGETLTKADLLGKIWLADFIFTRCAGPCPLMTQQMLMIQERLAEARLSEEGVLVSITVDPAYDTPKVLRDYARQWGADLSNWRFLTGPEEPTLKLIREGFKITAEKAGTSSEGSHSMPDIRHSTNFLLVDREGWIRRIYHLDDPDLPAAVVDGIQNLQ